MRATMQKAQSIFPITTLAAVLILFVASLASADDAGLMAYDEQTSWVDTGIRALVFPDRTALISSTTPKFFVRTVELSTSEYDRLRNAFSSQQFFNLPDRIATTVTDGNSIDLGYCAGDRCYTVYEYMADGPSARSVFALAETFKSIFEPKLSGAKELTPRAAADQVNKRAVAQHERAVAALFLRHLSEGTRPAFPDDKYICFDPTTHKAAIREENGPNCRPQLVWPSIRWSNESEIEKRSQRDGFICQIGPLTFFTEEPLNNIGIAPGQPPRNWCERRSVSCNETLLFAVSKLCAPKEMNDLSQLADVTASPLPAPPCSGASGALVEAWEYEPQCEGSESCLLGDQSLVLDGFSELEQSRTLPLGDDHRPFFRKTFAASASAEKSLTRPGIYCATIRPSAARVEIAEAKLIAPASIPVAEPTPPSTVALQALEGIRCHGDQDCVKVGSSCALRSLGEKIAQSSGQKLMEAGCKCAQGPILFGCVPDKR
ncbi:MAG: hypothetical protein U0136_03750 [Bdellovibrionota bacterium]